MTDEFMTTAAADSFAFWRFSLALYQAPSAAEQCLALQDEGGVDVNLALYALWIGHRRGPIGAAAMARAATLSLEWRRRAVGPLRSIRRDLKSGVADLDWPGLDWCAVREAIKRVELMAEQAQQAALQRIADAAPAARAPEDAGRVAREAFDQFAALTGWSAGSEAPAFAALIALAAEVDETKGS